MMFNRLLIILLISLLFISPISKAEVSAEADKSEIVFGETISLTISSDGADNPDLDTLKNLFNIMGVQQSQEVSYINGKTSSVTRWIISLTPKQKSNIIIIPPITLGKQQTKPINIKIIDKPKTLTNISGKDILKTEISLDSTSAYIQQQIILTLRIYANEQSVVRVTNLIAPSLPDFAIKQLKDHNYSQNINNLPYTIVERRYALSAQKSGELKIPSFALSAIVINDKNQSENKTVMSNELTVKIKPKPANYPAKAAWLPAKNLMLEEKWNQLPDKVLQGDTLTRSITITAQGLTSQQIGPLPNPPAMGVRAYPDQPKLQDTWQQNMSIGSREEQQVLIPIQTGDVTIPEIKVPWWNTDKDQLEYATVAGHKIKVDANPAFNNMANTSPLNPSDAPNSTNSPTIVQKIVSPTLWLWQLSTIILAITTLLGFSLWIYARKQPAIIKEAPPVINPKTLLDDIKKSCQDGDPQATRLALDNWVKQQPENLTEMVARFSPLAEAVEELNKALYSEVETAHTWRGDGLWQAIQNLPKNEQPSTQTASALPPLYPK